MSIVGIVVLLVASLLGPGPLTAVIALALALVVAGRTVVSGG